MSTPENSPRPRSTSTPGQSPAVEPLHDFALKVIEQVKEAMEGGDQRALFAAERSLEILLKRVEAECLKADPLRVLALHAASRMAFHLNDWQKAEDYLTKAIQITSAHIQPGDREELLCTLQMSKARLMSALGRPEEALVLWKATLDFSQEDTAGRAAVFIEMAQAHMAAGRPQEYAKLMQQVFFELPRNPSEELTAQLAFVFANAAMEEVNQGRFESAIGLWQASLDYLRALPGDNRENIESALMGVADCQTKLGRFDLANQRRQEALVEATARLGEEHGRVMNIREALAFGLLESEMYGFEKAETLLDRNRSIAQQHGEVDHIAEAVISLSKARRQKGMYQQAAQGIRDTLDALDVGVGPHIQVKLLKEMADILVECGLSDKATSMLEGALQETKQLSGPGAIVAQIALLASMANLLSNKDPQKARDALNQCYDLLVDLPAGVEPVSMKELRLVSLSLDGEDANAKEGESVASQRLDEFERESGDSDVAHRVQLMLAKARYHQQCDKTDSALALLEQSKSLLEQRFRNHTTLYGAVLLNLAELLPPGDPQADECRGKAEQIFQKVRDALRNWGEVDGDEDEDEWGHSEE